MPKMRDKPSTKARKTGYAKMHSLRRLLAKLIFPNLGELDWSDEAAELWVNHEFNKNGWRDFMIRHVPENKRGGLP